MICDPRNPELDHRYVIVIRNVTFIRPDGTPIHPQDEDAPTLDELLKHKYFAVHCIRCGYIPANAKEIIVNARQGNRIVTV